MTSTVLSSFNCVRVTAKASECGVLHNSVGDHAMGIYYLAIHPRMGDVCEAAPRARPPGRAGGAAGGIKFAGSHAPVRLGIHVDLRDGRMRLHNAANDYDVNSPPWFAWGTKSLGFISWGYDIPQSKFVGNTAGSKSLQDPTLCDRKLRIKRTIVERSHHDGADGISSEWSDDGKEQGCM
ncbi:hypothetical protein EVAR_60362_1 [Eumeta japonica]|uniref:Uncharacterized protein n=1 Tax=Eumeta variegata TaxID=151549 RepID=A0A4C1Z8H5_EUMVA|nr:hypothetical protein EVAR_60362_1 [Eumeta japonica]